MAATQILRCCRLGCGSTIFRHIEPAAYASYAYFHRVERRLVPLPSQICCGSTRFYSGKNEKVKQEKLSIFKRFKQMYRDYWYVLLPVHLVTSVGWFGGFYYIAER